MRIRKTAASLLLAAALLVPLGGAASAAPAQAVAPQAMGVVPAHPTPNLGWWCKWANTWYFTTSYTEVRWNRLWYGYYSCLDGRR